MMQYIEISKTMNADLQKIFLIIMDNLRNDKLNT